MAYNKKFQIALSNLAVIISYFYWKLWIFYWIFVNIKINDDLLHVILILSAPYSLFLFLKYSCVDNKCNKSICYKGKYIECTNILRTNIKLNLVDMNEQRYLNQIEFVHSYIIKRYLVTNVVLLVFLCDVRNSTR